MPNNLLDLSVRTSIGDVNAILPEYQRLSGKTDYEVLTKQGGKLGREMYFQLRIIRPEKGSIRESVLARLRAGKGIKIRDSVAEAMEAKWGDKVKTSAARMASKFHDEFWGEETPGFLNWKWLLQQKKVAREIAVRESGRGVLSVSSKYPVTIKDAMLAMSRFGSVIGQVQIRDTSMVKFASFVWRGQDKRSDSVTAGIGRKRAHDGILKAIQIVKDDILAYILPRRQGNVAESIRKGLKPV